MSETFLNGKITVTPLAAPTSEDFAKQRALYSKERSTLLSEAIERGLYSGVSTKTVDEIWDSARQKAKAIQENKDYSL
jgi:hypothetical protein